MIDHKKNIYIHAQSPATCRTFIYVFTTLHVHVPVVPRPIHLLTCYLCTTHTHVLRVVCVCTTCTAVPQVQIIFYKIRACTTSDPSTTLNCCTFVSISCFSISIISTSQQTSHTIFGLPIIIFCLFQ
jgi:hypothetical protein